MKDKTTIGYFFDLSTPVFKRTPNYQKLGNTEILLNTIGEILPHNSYIIDHYRKNFFYVSNDSIFLCGYSREEVLEMGYDFYERILSPEDLKKLIEINKARVQFFNSLDKSLRSSSYSSYDLVLCRKDGRAICVNHKIKPYLLTFDQNAWLSICCMKYSVNNKSGNVFYNVKKNNQRFSYSFKTKEWVKLPPIILSPNEKVVAIEVDRGTPDKLLSDILNVSKDTITYYKKQILKKTGTTTIKKAIDILTSNGII